MDNAALRLERTGAIAEIVLARPERMNALDTAFWERWPVLLDEVDTDPSIRVVIIRGEGKHFSAGMDLDFFPAVRALETSEPGRYRDWIRRKVLALQAALTRLETLRAPVIAVTQGACIGGALDLVCATNIRVATSDAFYRIHEINIGMMADLGVLQRLPKLLPPAVVHDLALTGRPMPAAEALERGFINSIAETHEQALLQAHDMATRIAALSPLAVSGTKAALNHARDHSVEEGLGFASLWNAGMFVSEDVPRALAAQKQRVQAQFLDLLP
jgi:enoyl-CoA hydratase/carnithine racemase